MPLKTNITLEASREKYKQEINLISKGYYAPDHFPEGKITVYPWDSDIDEFITKNAKDLDEHQVTDFMWNVVPKVANLKGFDVNNMLMGDCNTILLVARGIRNRGVLRYTAKCPYCDRQQKEETIKIPEHLDVVGEKAVGYPGFDIFQLHDSKDWVKFEPITVGAWRAINARSDSKKMIESGEHDQLLSQIKAVGTKQNDLGTPDSIQELYQWFNALHPSDRDQLAQAEDVFTPCLSPFITHQCDNKRCNRQFKYELPIGDPSSAADFFRPVSLPEHGGDSEDEVRAGDGS